MNIDEFKRIWKNTPLIVLDTNIILELYRCSSDMCENAINIYMKFIKDTGTLRFSP